MGKKLLVTALVVAFVILGIGYVVFDQRRGVVRAQPAAPTPPEAQSTAPGGQAAQYDRGMFEKSAKSIARPDLQACANLDAKFTQGSDVDVDRFARSLHGT